MDISSPKIDDWIAQGMMEKVPIMERLDLNIQNSHAIREEEKAAFKEIFARNTILTKPAFVSLLATRGTLPHSLEGVEAGEIIYDSIAYLASLPFPQYPEADDQPDGLASNQLMRGLAWAIPGRYAYIVEEGPDTRERTESDRWRLIFQSLASVTDVETASSDDNDDDEIYQDLLDVVYSTQEVKDPGKGPLPRDWFRSIAKSLKSKNNNPSLNELGIPIQRFVALVRCLLALQFDSAIDISPLNGAAQSIVSSFLQKPDDQVITWRMFEYGMRNVAPYLLDSYYRLLSQTFLGTPSPLHILDTATVPPATEGVALALPLQSQLVTFLAGSVAFESFTRMHHYDVSNLPTSTALVNTMQAVPDEALLALFGKDMTTGVPCTFGLFSPKPKADGSSIQTNIIPDHVGYERCALFQLTPVQGVYRGVVGKPGWIVDDKSVTFGQGSGVVLSLKDNLTHAEVRHEIANADAIASTYEPNSWRENWVINFEVSEIEIWSEKAEE